MPPVSKRRPPNRRRSSPARSSGRRAAPPDFEALLAGLLADPDPLAFIGHATSVVDALTSPAASDEIDVEAFLDVVLRDDAPAVRAFGAMLSVLAPQLVPQPVRVTAPPWLARIGEARVSRTVLMLDLGGDADQIAAEVRLADGSRFCLLVLVHHDLGSAVQDAFAVDTPLEAVIERFGQIDDAGVRLDDLGPADAGARLRQSLAATDVLLDPPDSDSWPQQRPLLEWVLRMLPAGGAGWPRVHWSEAETTRSVRAIVRRARPSIGPDAEDVVRLLLQRASQQALGDPLRWSERSTALVLQWLSTHVSADEEWWGQVPAAVEEVVRYAHAERGLPPTRTDEALEVVDAWEDQRQEDELAALMEGLEDLRPDHLLRPEQRLQRLADEVGGDDVLDALTAEPLDEAATDLTRVPPEALPKVQEAVAILEPVLEDFFDDPELRIAAVSFLARAAEAQPGLFRPKANAALTAAAAAWVAAKVNDAFGPRRIGDLMTAFGLRSSASTRGNALLHALGLDWSGPSRTRLGDAGLLTSRRRGSIVGARDDARILLADEDASPFPTSITTEDGATIRVQHRPGLGAEVLDELRPLLAADGIDLDDPDAAPDLATLQAGMDRAVEQRNAALFAPVGGRRTAALSLLREFTTAIAAGDDERAVKVLERAQPESHDERVPEVSAVIGVALGLVDDWLSGRAPDVPRDLGARLLTPKQWRKRARPATEILALGTRDRAAESLHALIVRQGGHAVLAGAMLAVAVAAQAWAARTDTPLETLLPRIVR